MGGTWKGPPEVSCSTERFLEDTEIAGIEVYADPMLEKVFFNLLDNSIRHGQHVTEIRVSSCRSPEGLKILWEDNGIGIVPEEEGKDLRTGIRQEYGAWNVPCTGDPLP